MSILTDTFHDKMSGDSTLADLLASYMGEPAVFTIDPAPGDAMMPYIVTTGEVAQTPEDTKTTLGREMFRDIRCYDDAGDDARRIEAIAERVRALFHRQALVIDGYEWMLSECSGPIVADEGDAYGRVISVRVIAHTDTRRVAFEDFEIAQFENYTEIEWM